MYGKNLYIYFWGFGVEIYFLVEDTFFGGRYVFGVEYICLYGNNLYIYFWGFGVEIYFLVEDKFVGWVVTSAMTDCIHWEVE